MPARNPSYRLHKPSRQAVVTLAGNDHYLGPHGSPESRQAYERLVAEWLASRQRPPEPVAGLPDLTINELLLAYWDHARSYYVKDGKPTSEPDTIRQALRPVRELYGDTQARDFGPLALKAGAGPSSTTRSTASRSCSPGRPRRSCCRRRVTRR